MPPTPGRSFGPAASDFNTTTSTTKKPKKPRLIGRPGARAAGDGKRKGKERDDGEQEGEEGGKVNRKGKRRLVDVADRAMKLHSPEPASPPPPPDRPTRRTKPLAPPPFPLPAPAAVAPPRTDSPSQARSERPLVRLSLGGEATSLLDRAAKALAAPSPAPAPGKLQRLVAPPVAPQEALKVKHEAEAGPSRMRVSELEALAAPLLSSIRPPPVPGPPLLHPLPSTSTLPLALPVPPLPAPTPPTPSAALAPIEDLLSPRKKRRPGAALPFGLASKAEEVLKRARSEWGMWRSDAARSVGGVKAEGEEEEGEGPTVLEVEEVEWTGSQSKLLLARCRLPLDNSSGPVLFSLNLAPLPSSSSRAPPPRKTEGKRAVTEPIELVREVKVGARVWVQEPWTVVTLPSESGGGGDREGGGRTALIVTRFGVM